MEQLKIPMSDQRRRTYQQICSPLLILTQVLASTQIRHIGSTETREGHVEDLGTLQRKNTMNFDEGFSFLSQTIFQPVACSSYPACVDAGLIGDCCPTSDGNFISCCEEGAFVHHKFWIQNRILHIYLTEHFDNDVLHFESQ